MRYFSHLYPDTLMLSMKKIKSKTINVWLSDVAATSPVPGGGSAVCLAAATAAGLVQMAASYTTGEKWADRAETMNSAISETAMLRQRALTFMDQDVITFQHVIASYALDSKNQEQKAKRSESIRQSLIDAAKPLQQIALLSHRLSKLCSDLALMADPVVLSDVAVAASYTRCALEGCIVNLEQSLRLISDPVERKSIALIISSATSDIQVAHAVHNIVRERLEAP